MPSESVKVMVRVRPMNGREKDQKCTTIVEVDTNAMSVALNNPSDAESQKVFTYDAVFAENSAQQSIYETSAFQLVESVIEGYNGTIFAYGQTGCGKTHTMMGNPSDDNLKGIIPRAFAHIFGNIESTPHKNFLVRCSYIEIYNEEIRDLIGQDFKSKLELKESPDKGIFIKDLSMHIVKSVPEIEKLMNYGSKNRSVGETAMNKDSSRSHSIFTIYIESSEEDGKGNQRITAGKLNLVDLAGSERQSKTQATGDRLKEATKINLSLSALGNVISALVDGKSSHVPYRDSKLTRLLQDSLGGNTKTVMIANISPASDNYDETMGTLRYASRAKNIKNQPKVNEDPKDAMLREYAEEIKRLKDLLQNQGGNPDSVQPMLVTRGISKESVEESSYGRLVSKNTCDSITDDYVDELKNREQAILDERRRREELEAKLKEMEQQFIVGGVPDAGPGKKKNAKEPEEKKQYQEMLQKLKSQELKHEELLKEKQQKEEEAISAEKKYASLQEEAEDMRKLAKKLRKKLQNAQKDIKDVDRENEYQKAELLDTIRLLERDMKIHNAIMIYLLSSEELDKIKGNSKWSEDSNEFIIPKFTVKVKKQKLPMLPGLNSRNGPENEAGEEEGYGPDDDWEQTEEASERGPTLNTREKGGTRENGNNFKSTRNNFYPIGGMLDTKRDGNLKAPASLPASIRNSSQNLLPKYTPNDYYESKNPNIVNQFAKIGEKSPLYNKKQPGVVRLEPINGTLPASINPHKNQDYSSPTLDLNQNLPKKGKGQLAPISSSSNKGPMKLQFKATVYIDQEGQD